MEDRLKNEIKFGSIIADKAEEIWNWSTPAGKIRLQRKINYFKNFVGNKNANILEIGCGTGIFTKALAKTCKNITAIDISPDLLKIAKAKTGKSGKVKFLVRNAYATDFKNNNFDYVYGCSILHHLDMDKALKELIRILKPGGKIIFTEPNHLNPQIIIERSPFFRKYFFNSPDETAFFRGQLLKQLKRYGFKNIDIVPFDFLHPYTPNYLIKYIKPMGLFMEKLPLVKEISGSLLIMAEK
jgi:ubiquinone/menaquinone biosynthesis C-methylase UbiE